MANIDEIVVEYSTAKEQLKQINATINRDRETIAELEGEIAKKREEVELVNKEIEGLNGEKASLELMRKEAEESFGSVRDELKAEINKLGEKKKKDEAKYQISIEELSNDVRVLNGRKDALQNEVSDLESEKVKVAKDRDAEIAYAEGEIKKVKEKLNDFVLLFDEQDAKYRKCNREIEDMNSKLEEKANIEAEIGQLEKSIEETRAILVSEKANVEIAKEELKGVKAEVSAARKEVETAKKEAEGYVKQKMDIRERKEQLELKEKFLRKKYEEAGLNFSS